MEMVTRYDSILGLVNFFLLLQSKQSICILFELSTVISHLVGTKIRNEEKKEKKFPINPRSVCVFVRSHVSSKNTIRIYRMNERTSKRLAHAINA